MWCDTTVVLPLQCVTSYNSLIIASQINLIWQLYSDQFKSVCRMSSSIFWHFCWKQDIFIFSFFLHYNFNEHTLNLITINCKSDNYYLYASLKEKFGVFGPRCMLTLETWSARTVFSSTVGRWNSKSGRTGQCDTWHERCILWKGLKLKGKAKRISHCIGTIVRQTRFKQMVPWHRGSPHHSSHATGVEFPHFQYRSRKDPEPEPCPLHPRVNSDVYLLPHWLCFQTNWPRAL